jgi:hypothetical protein
LVLGHAAAAQTSAASAPSATIDAIKIAKPPVIDGSVAEDEWQGATVATAFIQYEPRRGERSDLRTEVFVLYDAETG